MAKSSVTNDGSKRPSCWLKHTGIPVKQHWEQTNAGKIGIEQDVENNDNGTIGGGCSFEI